ncbi:MAG: hypothetical protein ACI4UE_01000 [Candidatus Scatovivens sp.]
MDKRLNSMPINEIYKKIGRLISPEDVYLLIEDLETLQRYGEIYNKYEKNIPELREKLYDFLLKEESKVDKGIFVLLTLEKYFEAKVFTKDTYEKNKKIYDSKIEECKKLLDGEDISIYRHKVNEKTGIVNEIVETSSVELCAMKVEEDVKSEKQKRLDRKRTELEEKRKNSIEKRKNRNTQRLDEIEKDIDLKYILQFISLADIEDALVNNESIGELLRFKILRNTIVRKTDLTPKELNKALINEQLEDIADKLDPKLYLEEFKKTIREYSEYFDIDKILLCSAYRAVERLSVETYKAEDIDGIKNILIAISEKLGEKNIRLSTNLVNTNGKEEKVKYDKNKLKYDLKRFVSPNIFLSDKLIKQIKEELLTGKKILKEISFETLVMLNLKQEELDKIVKSSSENFIYFLDNFQYSQKDVQEVIRDIKHINTECLYKLIKDKLIDKDGIVQECKNQKIYLDELVELASINEIDDETIIKSFNELKGNDVLDEILNKDVLLEYFNIKKIEEYIKQKKIDDEFLEFYVEILPEDEIEKNKLLENISGLISDVTDKGIIINFYINKLISEDSIIGKLEEDDILELYENNKIDINAINRLYNKKIIGEESFLLILDDEYKNKDILELLDSETIDIKVAVELYNLSKDKKLEGIFNRYSNNEFKTPNPALLGFATSNLNIEEIDELYKRGDIKEKDLYDVASQGIFSTSKISQLYTNMLISENIIDKLYNDKIINKHENELMKKALNMKNIVKNMDKSLGIAFGSDGEIEIDEGIFLPEEKSGNSNHGWNKHDDYDEEEKEKKKVIHPAIRERKFETYGAKRIKRNNVEYNEKSPFNDYEFYIIPDFYGNKNPNCIVIAERYYKDKYSGEEELIDGNATYLFELKDLTRISKKSKPEILLEMKEARDTRMKRKLHTKNWAKNMDKAIQELLGKKLESCYTESELHDIKTLSELIDGFKDKNNLVRIFDIEFE